MDKDYTILINRKHPLPEDFIPEHLVDIGLPFDAVPGEPKRLLEEKTARSALELITRSRSEGLNLYCISGYRSYRRQKELFTGDSYVAPPGSSEHQSGLALDMSCPAVQMELTEAFAMPRFLVLLYDIPKIKNISPVFHGNPGISAM